MNSKHCLLRPILTVRCEFNLWLNNKYFVHFGFNSQCHFEFVVYLLLSSYKLKDLTPTWFYCLRSHYDLSKSWWILYRVQITWSLTWHIRWKGDRTHVSTISLSLSLLYIISYLKISLVHLRLKREGKYVLVMTKGRALRLKNNNPRLYKTGSLLVGLVS